MPKKEDLREGLLTELAVNNISQYLLSKCTLVDLNLGGGAGMGFKRGVFHRISGTKGAGKTFLITEIGATAKKQYGDNAKVAIQDCESRNTMDTELLYGVPRDELLSEDPPMTVEALDAHLGLFGKNLRKKEIGIYGVDSLESLSNANVQKRSDERQKKMEDGKDVVDKGDMGMQSAKFFSQEFFRIQAKMLAKTEATCFLLSQMRENVDKKNPYSPKYKTTGGPGIEHWCDSASELKVIHQLGEKERPIGAVVELKTTKLTAPRPFRKCRYVVYYTYGIDNIGSNLDYLFNLRSDDGKIREKQAECITWEGITINKTILKEWMEKFDEDNETNLLKEARKVYKKEKGRTAISLDFHQEWLRNHEADKVRDSFCADFGTEGGRSYTRAELITAIEADASGAMEKELEQRVIDKWESIELEAVAELAGRKRRN